MPTFVGRKLGCCPLIHTTPTLSNQSKETKKIYEIDSNHNFPTVDSPLGHLLIGPIGHHSPNRHSLGTQRAHPYTPHLIPCGKGCLSDLPIVEGEGGGQREPRRGQAIRHHRQPPILLRHPTDVLHPQQ